MTIPEKLYGAGKGKEFTARLSTLMQRYGNILPPPRPRYIFSEKDCILITYPDQINSPGRASLDVLKGFLDTHVRETINSVHILPFFPWSSDDGFSVIDYHNADPRHGGWPAVETLGGNYTLMVDAVLNHLSSRSDWFRRFLSGEKPYDNYFITADPKEDLSAVTRPRPTPLLTPFKTASGKKWLWTTFSADQIDLNFREPEVLLSMIDVLLDYVRHGARIIRLDAVAYIWKEIGTPCIHQPEAHLIVKLMRAVLDKVAPQVTLITETNVPHAENISYFGNGTDEAQMVYQFSLPPLVAHGLLSQSARALKDWASGLTFPHGGATYLNFTASHDGIGVRPLAGLVPDTDVDSLIHVTQERGGGVSCKTNTDGSSSPYELNINYMSLLSRPGEEEALSIRRFLLSQSIMLIMPGVPGIYFHSLVGSLNDGEGVKRTGALRSINREKIDFGQLEDELKANPRRRKVFAGYQSMLTERRKEPAFSPSSEFAVLPSDDALFAVMRTPQNGPPVIAVHNMTEREAALDIPIGLPVTQVTDILSGAANQYDRRIVLGPFDFRWLKVK